MKIELTIKNLKNNKSVSIEKTDNINEFDPDRGDSLLDSARERIQGLLENNPDFSDSDDKVKVKMIVSDIETTVGELEEV
jgi:hypothetical protein